VYGASIEAGSLVRVHIHRRLSQVERRIGVNDRQRSSPFDIVARCQVEWGHLDELTNVDCCRSCVRVRIVLMIQSLMGTRNSRDRGGLQYESSLNSGRDLRKHPTIGVWSTTLRVLGDLIRLGHMLDVREPVQREAAGAYPFDAAFIRSMHAADHSLLDRNFWESFSFVSIRSRSRSANECFDAAAEENGSRASSSGRRQIAIEQLNQLARLLPASVSCVTWRCGFASEIGDSAEVAMTHRARSRRQAKVPYDALTRRDRLQTVWPQPPQCIDAVLRTRHHVCRRGTVVDPTRTRHQCTIRPRARACRRMHATTPHRTVHGSPWTHDAAEIVFHRVSHWQSQQKNRCHTRNIPHMSRTTGQYVGQQ
jgi:hypothetical protein